MNQFLITRFNNLGNLAVDSIHEILSSTRANRFAACISDADRIHRYSKCISAINQTPCKCLLIEDIHKVYRAANGQYYYKGHLLNSNGRIIRKRCDDGNRFLLAYVHTPIRDMRAATEYYRAYSLWLAKEFGVNYYNVTDISLSRWFDLSDERKAFAHVSK